MSAAGLDSTRQDRAGGAGPVLIELDNVVKRFSLRSQALFQIQFVF